MGLDMYLTKRYYVKNWNHMKQSELHRISITKGGKKSEIDTDKIREIITEVGYWRKANHIHKWFVDNVQDGFDDCRDSYVSREQLKELLSICKEVVEKSKLVDGTINNGFRYENGKEIPITEPGKIIKDSTIAEKLLPCRSGFFFGSTDYDQYYLEDVVNTIKILEEALIDDDGEIYYHSSW